MEELVLNRKRKTMMVKLSIGLLTALIVLTFLSKTINGILLPKVTVASTVKGSLQKSFETEGAVELQNKSRIIASGNWKVEEIAVRVNQQIKKGDLLAVVDNSESELTLKRKELEILRFENSIDNLQQEYDQMKLSDLEREVQLAKTNVDYAKKNLENSINEKKTELQLLKIDYENVKKSVHLNGRILAESDGLITAVNMEAGYTTSANQPIFEIATSDTSWNFVWYMNPQKAANYEIGQDVTVKGKGIHLQKNGVTDEVRILSEYSMSLRIIGSEPTPDKSQIKFWAEITEEQKNNAEVMLYEGDKASVTGVKSSEIYDTLLQKGAITQINGVDCIFVVREIDGALGTEKIVEQREVKILGEDDFKVAVSGFLRESDLIVVNSTKTLSNRMQVQVR